MTGRSWAPHVFRNLDAFEERYEDDTAEMYWQARKVRLVAALIRSLPCKDVAADVGCGSGFACAEYLAAGIGQLHGFDISPKGLALAAQRGMVTDLWNFEGEDCPRPDASFDLVVAADVIEHLVDTDHFVAELMRIIKPGGYLIVTTPNLASWYNRYRLLRGRVPTGYPGVSANVRLDTNIDLNHVRVNVASEWIELFRRSGLMTESISGWSHLQAWRGTLRSSIIRRFGRWAEHRPSMAENLIFLLRTPP